MAVFSGSVLSGSTNGQPIPVAATSTPGTTIHVVAATGFEEVYLFASNVTVNGPVRDLASERIDHSGSRTPGAARRRGVRAAAPGPGRTLVAIVAIALGVALGFSVYLINRVAADEVELASRSLFGMADLAVRAPGQGFDEGLYPLIASVPGVAVASPVVEALARIPGRDSPLRLVGIDPFRAWQLQPAVASAGATGSSGGGLLAENSVWLSPSAAQRYGLEVGDEFRIHPPAD